MQRVTSPVAYFASAVSTSIGAFFTALGSLTLQELEAVAVWVGMGTAVGTFLVNWWYKAKDLKRSVEDAKLNP